MFRWKTIVSAFMLLLWMPATSHCALEAAGLLPRALGCSSAEETHCTGDGCKVIESGLFKQSSITLKVAAPDQLVHICFLCLQLVGPDSLVAVSDFSVTYAKHPQDWLACWAFEHRTALPARAPSLV